MTSRAKTARATFGRRTSRLDYWWQKTAVQALRLSDRDRSRNSHIEQMSSFLTAQGNTDVVCHLRKSADVAESSSGFRAIRWDGQLSDRLRSVSMIDEEGPKARLKDLTLLSLESRLWKCSDSQSS